MSLGLRVLQVVTMLIALALFVGAGVVAWHVWLERREDGER